MSMQAAEPERHGIEGEVRAHSETVQRSISAPTHVQGSLLVLALGALGVVYGDIGTSPLYALRECFVGDHALAVTAPNVLGILSLVFWSLTMVVSVKYLMFLMRADNDGEGGI